MKTLLKGNFDLLLTSGCTLSCKGCSYLDYLDMGNTICNFLVVDNLISILEKLSSLDLILDRLTFLGGEPTLHPDFVNLARTASRYRGISFNELVLHTNATFLDEKFATSIEEFDKIVISAYPVSRELIPELESTNFFKKYNSKFYLKNVDTFLNYGQKRPDLEYSKFLNWERCNAKNKCRVITTEGIYRCFISYNNKQDLCSFDNRQDLIDYIYSDKPISSCENCPWPPARMPWKSNNLEKDKKRVRQGIKFIQQLDNYA